MIFEDVRLKAHDAKKAGLSESEDYDLSDSKLDSLGVSELIQMLLLSAVMVLIVSAGILTATQVLVGVTLISIAHKVSKLIEVSNSDITEEEKIQKQKIIFLEIFFEIFIVACGGKVVKGIAELSAPYAASLGATLRIQSAIVSAFEATPAWVKNSFEFGAYTKAFDSIDDLAEYIVGQVEVMYGADPDHPLLKTFEYIEKQRQIQSALQEKSEIEVEEINNGLNMLKEHVRENRDTNPEMFGVPIGSIGKKTEDDSLELLRQEYVKEKGFKPKPEIQITITK